MGGMQWADAMDVIPCSCDEILLCLAVAASGWLCIDLLSPRLLRRQPDYCRADVRRRER